MIEVTPHSDSNSQVTVGDKARVRWLLDAHVDPDNVVMNVGGIEKTGSDLSEMKVDIGGQWWWRYETIVTLPQVYSAIEFSLQDPANEIVDTAYIYAREQLT